MLFESTAIMYLYFLREIFTQFCSILKWVFDCKLESEKIWTHDKLSQAYSIAEGLKGYKHIFLSNIWISFKPLFLNLLISIPLKELQTVSYKTFFFKIKLNIKHIPLSMSPIYNYIHRNSLKSLLDHHLP